MADQYHPTTISLPSREWKTKATSFAKEHLKTNFSKAIVLLFEEKMAEVAKRQETNQIEDSIQELKDMVLELKKQVKSED